MILAIWKNLRFNPVPDVSFQQLARLKAYRRFKSSNFKVRRSYSRKFPNCCI